MENIKEVKLPNQKQIVKSEVRIILQEQSNEAVNYSQEVVDYQGRANGFLTYAKAWRVIALTILSIISMVIIGLGGNSFEEEEIIPLFNEQQEVPSTPGLKNEGEVLVV